MSNIVEYNQNKAGVVKFGSYQEAWHFAKIIADSDFAPKDYKGKPANVMIAIQWGSEIGMAPMQSVQNIAVINGKPSIYGDAMLAIVQGSGLLELIHEEVSQDFVATCRVKRKGQPEAIRSFSKQDAETANLWGKTGYNGKPTPWVTYPKRMLQMRARALALRDVFPDVLMGIYSAEEARDIGISDYEDVTPTEQVPKQIEAPKTPPETAEPLATDEQKKIIQNFCAQAKFDGKAFAGELKRDFGQVWDTMTDRVAAQMIERLGIRIDELEGRVA